MSWAAQITINSSKMSKYLCTLLFMRRFYILIYGYIYINAFFLLHGSVLTSISQVGSEGFSALCRAPPVLHLLYCCGSDLVLLQENLLHEVQMPQSHMLVWRVHIHRVCQHIRNHITHASTSNFQRLACNLFNYLTLQKEHSIAYIAFFDAQMIGSNL